MTPKQKSPNWHIAHSAMFVLSAILFFSASAAVAQLPPPPIRVVPNLNPSSSLVLPAPTRTTLSPAPTLSTVTGCCYGNRHALRHQVRKSHARQRPPDYSTDTQERIAELQRRAAERAEVALESVIGETGGRAKHKQPRVKPKRGQ